MRSNSLRTDKPQSCIRANVDQSVIAQSSISTNQIYTTIRQAQIIKKPDHTGQSQSRVNANGDNCVIAEPLMSTNLTHTINTRALIIKRPDRTDKPQSRVNANGDQCVIAQSSISSNLTPTTIPETQDGSANSDQSSTVTTVNTHRPVCETIYCCGLNVCEEKNQTDGSYSLNHSNCFGTEINEKKVLKDLRSQVSNNLKDIESSFNGNCQHVSIIGFTHNENRSQVFLDEVVSLAIKTAAELKSFRRYMEWKGIRKGMEHTIIEKLAEIKSDFQIYIEEDTEKTKFLYQTIGEFQKELNKNFEDNTQQ